MVHPPSLENAPEILARLKPDLISRKMNPSDFS
jgi:hypothetical protein